MRSKNEVCRPETPTPEMPAMNSFADALARSNVELRRGETTTLQVNVGSLCNQSCRHCHLSAGPDRSEVMSRETMRAVEAFARRGRFSTIDLTGGAPELVPGIEGFLERLAPLAPRILFRTNLTALAGRDDLIDLLARLRVAVVASFPSLSASQTDAQRGNSVFETSIGTLRTLNAAGFGCEDSGLELDLVSNPGGAFLPAEQAPAQALFRRELSRTRGITFNNLYTFANVPLGRFRAWLCASGNLESYLRQLATGFNPCTVSGLMCRSLVSVSWEGVLFDCDFNLAGDLPLGGVRRHVSSVEGVPPPGSVIATGDHCYSCTVGSGFT